MLASKRLVMQDVHCKLGGAHLCFCLSIAHPNFTKQYEGEQDLPTVMHLVDNELSEPYSIFTYRYFLHNWPKLCFLAFQADK